MVWYTWLILRFGYFYFGVPQCMQALCNMCIFFLHSSLLGRYYLRSKKGKDLKKSRKYLWGIENPVPVARNSSNQPASLFGDRKGNNLFNGLWRLPLSEVDRAGTFSSHMGNCLNTVLEFANMTKDHAILLDISILLRKPPNSSEKYLFEKQRVSNSVWKKNDNND